MNFALKQSVALSFQYRLTILKCLGRRLHCEIVSIVKQKLPVAVKAQFYRIFFIIFFFRIVFQISTVFKNGLYVTREWSEPTNFCLVAKINDSIFFSQTNKILNEIYEFPIGLFEFENFILYYMWEMIFINFRTCIRGECFRDCVWTVQCEKLTVAVYGILSVLIKWNGVF